MGALRAVWRWRRYQDLLILALPRNLWVENLNPGFSTDTFFGRAQFYITEEDPLKCSLKQSLRGRTVETLSGGPFGVATKFHFGSSLSNEILRAALVSNFKHQSPQHLRLDP